MFYSVACWNNSDPVDREIKKLNSKSFKILTLKENISMRLRGLGWEDLSNHWSKNKKTLTPEDLA